MSSQVSIAALSASYREAFASGDWVGCFVIALGYAADPKQSRLVRAQAWAEMASLAGVAPSLGTDGTDSGVFYIYRALELDDENIDAHAQAILQFSPQRFSGHQDRPLAESSLKYLQGVWDSLSPSYRNDIGIQVVRTQLSQ
jgi:hypothetical protein